MYVWRPQWGNACMYGGLSGVMPVCMEALVG